MRCAGEGSDLAMIEAYVLAESCGPCRAQPHYPAASSLEIVLLIASSVALGQSLVITGAAGWIAQGIAGVVVLFPPAGQIAIFMTFAANAHQFRIERGPGQQWAHRLQ